MTFGTLFEAYLLLAYHNIRGEGETYCHNDDENATKL